jgi:hypothetical protein
MRRVQTIIATLGLLASLTACGGKKDDSGARGGSAVTPPPPAPVTCRPGEVIAAGACLAVVTPAAITVVAAQESRLDELAKVLDQADVVGAPIELFDGIRQLEPWQALKAKSPRIAALDSVAGTLNNAVKTLRAFKGSLGEASARLGNLKGELDRLMTQTGAPRKLEEARALVSTQLRAAIEPLAAQVQDTLQNALVPLTTQLSELSDVIVMGCTMSKLSGGGDKMKDLCVQAKESFTKALAYLGDLKAKPAQLFNDVTAQLETQLGVLVDGETRKLLEAAQAKVNDALKLPAAGSGAKP